MARIGWLLLSLAMFMGLAKLLRVSGWFSPIYRRLEVILIRFGHSRPYLWSMLVAFEMVVSGFLFVIIAYSGFQVRSGIYGPLRVNFPQPRTELLFVLAVQVGFAIWKLRREKIFSCVVGTASLLNLIIVSTPFSPVEFLRQVFRVEASDISFNGYLEMAVAILMVVYGIANAMIFSVAVKDFYREEGQTYRALWGMITVAHDPKSYLDKVMLAQQYSLVDALQENEDGSADPHWLIEGKNQFNTVWAMIWWPIQEEKEILETRCRILYDKWKKKSNR